ncbi:MAG: AAA family ATPase, partial [Gammaproteobacteria bacterium]|nr:AAA family ATPase [Gammaproteobacteria bacterium]
GSAVLVSGEAGMGKTRLLDEFIAQHHQEGIILLGSGYEAQGEIPFLPLVEAVRPVLSTFGKTAS